MTLFSPSQRRFAEALSELAYCNPFLPERFEHERAVLGDAFEEEATVAWSRHSDWEHTRSNVRRLARETEEVAEGARKKLISGQSARKRELELYEDLALYVIYYRFISPFIAKASTSGNADAWLSDRVEVWPEFREEFNHFFHVGGVKLPSRYDAAHIFACLFQVWRAFWNIFDNIVGDSLPIAKLRAEVWQSIFTHDMRRYRRSLFHRMSDVTTLITGPSGTGKELVARAIGFSQYIPFDDKKQCFAGDASNMFITLNLSAMSPTLIESELFGHSKGAFTGAVADRVGWLELAPPFGTVFLDEIGELDPAIQVKLLRVVQSRQFQRLGNTEPRHFHGKIIAATNRDLAAEIRARRFREDLYYRLCSDQIHTVSLKQQLADTPGDLNSLIEFIVKRVAGEEPTTLAKECRRWISRNLADYHWPGNIRELEQCVRNVMIRGEYWPHESPGTAVAEDARKQWLLDAEQCTCTADNLLAGYCAWAHAQLGTYEATARALGIDRRTVKSKVDQASSSK